MAGHETPLRAVDLDLGYRGERVVHGAALELSAGRVTALVGPNGSGKSWSSRTRSCPRRR